MADVEGGFEVIYDAQSTTTSTGGPWQPGQVVVHRSGTSRTQRALAKWVLMDNNGCSRGEVLVTNFASTVESSVKKAATTDDRCPIRGIAAATIASNKYGFAIISGYCEQADTSLTAASGEYLTVSASVAGKVTPLLASVFNAGYVNITGSVASTLMVVAIARGAFATGVGSVQIVGTWG